MWMLQVVLVLFVVAQLVTTYTLQVMSKRIERLEKFMLKTKRELFAEFNQEIQDAFEEYQNNPKK